MISLLENQKTIAQNADSNARKSVTSAIIFGWYDYFHNVKKIRGISADFSPIVPISYRNGKGLWSSGWGPLRGWYLRTQRWSDRQFRREERLHHSEPRGRCCWWVRKVRFLPRWERLADMVELRKSCAGRSVRKSIIFTLKKSIHFRFFRRLLSGGAICFPKRFPKAFGIAPRVPVFARRRFSSPKFLRFVPKPGFQL